MPTFPWKREMATNEENIKKTVETSKTFLQALKKRAGVDRELLVLTFLLFLKFSLYDILVDNWSEISLPIKISRSDS